MNRRSAVIALLAVAAATVGAAGFFVMSRDTDQGCVVEVRALPTGQAELVPADELAPTGSVGRERRPVLEAVRGLGGPFGEVLAGRFYPTAAEVPAPVAAGDAVVLASPGGVIRAVDVPDGEVLWGRDYGAAAARGGLVGQDFVLLVGGSTPAVLAFDAADGTERGCVRVPVASAGATRTLLTDQAGRDVVVAAGPEGAPVVLSSLDPRGGVHWDRRLDQVEAGSLTVRGEEVVVGRVPPDPVRLAAMAVAGFGTPSLAAYSLADGAPTWSYPDDSSAVAAVVGVDGDGRLLALHYGPGRAGEAVARLVALDGKGQEVWTTPLGKGYWTATLWGSLVVAQGPDSRGGPVLRAFEAVDGRGVWQLRARDFPARGEAPRQTFGGGTPVGEEYAVPAPNGVLLVDPGTGRARPLDSPEPVDQVFAAGAHLLVKVGNALLVVEPVT